jgi:hypothetical protein
VHRTLPAEVTGEQALTLFLAIAVQPSLTPDELNESLPRLQHLARLMMSRRVAAPADVDSADDVTTTRLTTIRPTADPRIDPPTVRLAAVEPAVEPAPVMVTVPEPVTDAQADEIRAALERGPGEHEVTGGVVTVPQPSRKRGRHAVADEPAERTFAGAVMDAARGRQTDPAAAPFTPIRARKVPPMLRTILRALAGVAVLAVLLVGIAAVVATSPMPPSPTSSTPPAAAPVKPASPAVDEQAADGSLAGSGTYLVGTDVEPGTYRTTGPADESGVCYWARLKSTDGDLKSIIANEAATGSQIVTIGARDRAFTSRGCAPWTRSQ